MDIRDISSPEILKNMSIEECYGLADDIRHFLIESVSKTGGHLASNLGIVELTIAIHKVFNSPKDKIFFDVGHQCYTHKILTGRASQFDELRKYQGLSGFQKRCESEHDVWEAGHSSTSLSAALGMAVARDLNHENYSVVPVIGDGALESGMSLEALNEIGDEKKNLVIVFNDNAMSISKNVGALTKGFAKLRTNKNYTALKRDMKKVLVRNNVGIHILNVLKAIKNAVKKEVVHQGIFQEMGIEYLGPVDGYNIKDMISALETARDHDGPVVVHVLTQKGKGYSYCENDKLGYWHSVGSFDITTGESTKKPVPGSESWSFVVSETLCSLASKNESIVCLTPAMVVGSKLENFFSKFPDRAFDCGIAEEHAATFAAGLAISGKRPFLSVYSTFMQRAYDQINHDICRMDLPVVLGIDRAGLVGADGATHHGVFDIGLLRALPNMIIAQPSTSQEAIDLLTTAFSQNHPFAIRYPRSNVSFDKNKINGSIIEIGSWIVDGNIDSNKPIIATYGPNVGLVKERAKQDNLSVTIINCRFFKPLDEKVMHKLISTKNPIYVYENDMLAEGLGSAMLEWANLAGTELPITRLGIADEFVSFGNDEQLKKDCHMDLDSLFAAIKKDNPKQ